MAPEIILEKYTNKVDIFSFGVILYKLLTKNEKTFS